MRRRDFIAILGSAAACPVGAQPHPAAAGEKLWRVGLLSNGSPSSPPAELATSWRGEILRALAQNGFSVGKNLELVERYSEGDADRLPALAREINAIGVDAIVAVSSQAAQAALAATTTTPVVMVVGYDPVATGIISSFAHPGGRVTGINFQTPEGDAKRLEFLRDAIPGARRFGYLGMSYESTPKGAEMAQAAARLNIELTMHWVAGPAEYAAAFAAMKKEGVAGVVVSATQSLSSHAPQVAASAADNRLPTICEWEYMARLGCVFGFGHDITYGQRRVGEYIARILKGVAPSDLPVERMDAWKLTVNLHAAAQAGLTIPRSLLARADVVIE